MPSTAYEVDRATSRREALRKLRSEASAVDVTDDGKFQAIIALAQSVLELSDQALADALLVSRPTVNRWVRGKNLPHRAMRRPIFDWIHDQASKRLRVVESEERRTVNNAPDDRQGETRVAAGRHR